MTVDRYLRLIAGAFVVLSLALGYWVKPVLVSVHGLRGLEPVPVGVYELVSDDGDPSQSGRKGIIFIDAEERRPRKIAAGRSLRGFCRAISRATSKTRLLDKLRATEYRRLDERRQVYLDYTGGSLYAESQLAEAFRPVALRRFWQSALRQSHLGGDDRARRTHAPLCAGLFQRRRTITFSSSRKTPPER